MTSTQNALSAAATMIVGPAVAEFFVSHREFFTALGIVAFGIFMVYAVQRSNRKRGHESN